MEKLANVALLKSDKPTILSSYLSEKDIQSMDIISSETKLSVTDFQIKEHPYKVLIHLNLQHFSGLVLCQEKGQPKFLY